MGECFSYFRAAVEVVYIPPYPTAVETDCNYLKIETEGANPWINAV
jgi:hypothetical protein